MVQFQILNKMLHLKYPFQKYADVLHSTQLHPPRLKFETKLRKMFPTNLEAQLCTSYSHMENMENTAPNFKCLFHPIKCKHLNPRFLAMFGTCSPSQMSFSRLKVGKKLRNISSSSLAACAQLCTSHCYRRNTQRIACKF